jgi:hypothetical protein
MTYMSRYQIRQLALSITNLWPMSVYILQHRTELNIYGKRSVIGTE